MASTIFISKVFLGLALLCLALLARELSAAAPKAKVKDRFQNAEMQKTCKKDSRKALKSIFKDFGLCNSIMKNNTSSAKEHSSKMGCVVRCVLVHQKAITADGLVTNATLLLSIENRSTYASEPLFKLFHDCKLKFENDLDQKDPLCVKYGQFGYCIQSAVADVCEVPV